VSWHTVAIVISFRFLASVAFLSSLEVVVLALAALPSAIWELEVGLLLNGRFLDNDFLLWLESSEIWGKGLVERLDTASESSHLSKLVEFSDGWLLNGLLNLLEWWEVESLRNSLWEEFLSSLVLLFER